MYQWCPKDFDKKKTVAANAGKPIPLYQKALCGLTAGAIGACAGTPADLALVRMQADATLSPSQRQHYKNVFHAIYRVIADEGCSCTLERCRSHCGTSNGIEDGNACLI